MIQTIQFNDFIDVFGNAGREDTFSHVGKRALFDYLEDFEKEGGFPYELDVIALCCEYTESTREELESSYPDYVGGDDGIIGYLRDNTIVIDVSDDRFIIAEF